MRARAPEGVGAAGTTPGPRDLPAWTPWVVGALLLFVVSWPWPVMAPDRLVGSPFGEVDNHFWFLWLAETQLRGAPGPWTNLPDGWPIPMMDPVNLLFALPAPDPVAALRWVALGNLALAGLGAYLFARERVSRAAACVAMAAGMAAPFLSGIMDFGITESWPLGWLGLHAAATLRHARTGSAASALAAGGTLAAFLASGWYHAVFAVVAEAGLLAWVATTGPTRRVPWALVLAAALAGATRVPALLDYLAHQDLWSARFSALSVPDVRTDWRTSPSFGVDLLAFFLPSSGDLPVSRTVYLGWTVLVLGFAGGRAARWPLLIAGGLVVLAVGHWLRVAGQPGPVPLRMPAGVLVTWVPALQGLSHWFRAVGPATVFLAFAAGVGAERVARGRWPVLLALGGLLVVESIVASPTPWPRRSYAVDPPPLLADLPGPLLQLPIDDVGSPPPARSRRPYNQWQPFHGQPVAENYEGPDAVFRLGPAAAVLNGRCGAPVPRGTPDELPANGLAALRAAGLRWIVLHPELARRDCREALIGLLGPPTRTSDRVLAWAL